jgi:hypothetical protein
LELFYLLILHSLQLVTWVPKTVVGGGAWKILKVKGGFHQKRLGTPALSCQVGDENTNDSELDDNRQLPNIIFS